MSKKDIFDLKTDIYNFVLNYKNNLDKNNSKETQKYMFFLSLYNSLKNLSSETDINEFYNNMISENQKLKEEYYKLKEEYKTNKSNEIISKANTCIYKAECYKELIQIFKKYIKVQSGMDLYSQTISTSDIIINKLIRYNNFDPNSSEAKKLNEEIYLLRKNREEYFVSNFGNTIIDELFEIESIENRISITRTNKNKTYTLNSEAFFKELDYYINAINEYNFLNELSNNKYYKYNNKLSKNSNLKYFEKQYLAYIIKLKNLIISASKNKDFAIEIDGVKVNIDNFISYISCYNLDGNYKKYNSKYKNNKIGNNKISRKQYIEGLKFIERIQISLINELNKSIKGRDIVVEDSQIIKKDLIDLRDSRIKNLIQIINKNIGVNNGRK